MSSSGSVSRSIVIHDINEKGANETAEKVKALGRKAKVWVADVSNVAAMKKVVAEAEKHYGKIDVLVNNAGVASDRCPIEDVTEAMFDRSIGIHVRGTMFTTQAVIPKQLLVSAPGVLLVQNPQAPQSGGGMEILPRIAGDRVTLEFYLQQNTTSATVNRTVQAQRVGTTLSAKLGEWVEAGGQLTGGMTAGGVTASTQDLRGGGRLLYLRAIEIQ